MGKGKEGDGKGEKEGREGRGRTTCYESIVNWTPQLRKPSAAPGYCIHCGYFYVKATVNNTN